MSYTTQRCRLRAPAHHQPSVKLELLQSAEACYGSAQALSAEAHLAGMADLLTAALAQAVNAECRTTALPHAAVRAQPVGMAKASGHAAAVASCEATALPQIAPQKVS